MIHVPYMKLKIWYFLFSSARFILLKEDIEIDSTNKNLNMWHISDEFIKLPTSGVVINLDLTHFLLKDNTMPREFQHIQSMTLPLMFAIVQLILIQVRLGKFQGKFI